MEQLRDILIFTKGLSSFKLLTTTLTRYSENNFRRVETVSELQQQINYRKPDALICCAAELNPDNLKILNIRNEFTPSIPFISVVDTFNEDEAAELIKNGADDILLKQNLIRLSSAIELAADRRKFIWQKESGKKELTEKDIYYQKLAENFPNGTVSIYDKDLNMVFVAGSDLKKYGATAEDYIGKHFREVAPVETFEIAKPHLENAFKGITSSYETPYWDNRYYYVVVSPIQENGNAIEHIMVASQNITERYHHKKKAIESEQKLRDVLEHSVNLFYSHDTDGKLTYLSPQVATYLGYVPEENVNWTKFLTDNPINAKGIEYTQKAIDTGKTQLPYELELKKQNGEKIWVEVREAPIVKNGKTEGIVGSLTDITEKKRAYEELKRSEELYSELLDNISEVFYTVDESGIITFINSAVERTTGFKAAEVFGKQFGTFIHTDDRARILDNFYNLSATKRLKDDARIVKSDGNHLFAKITSTAIFDGEEFKGASGVLLDITEQQKAEEELKFRSRLLNEIGEAAIATDIEGNIIYWNKAAEKMYGWEASEALGRNVVDITPTESSFEDAKKIFKALSEGKKWEGEFNVKRKDGTSFTADVSNAPVFNEEGELISIIGISSDITEQKRMRDRLAYKKGLLSETQRIAHLGSWEFDIGKNTLYWSDEVFRLFGLKPQEFGATYEAFLDAVHPDDKSLVDSAYSDSINNDEDSYQIEHRIIRKDNGEIRHVKEKCQHYRDNKGKIIRSVGMVQDITEQVNAKEHIDKLSKAIEQSPVSVVITDTEGNIEYVNEKFKVITGYTSEEVIGINPRALKSGTQSREFYKELWDTILAGNTWQGELHNRKKNGELYWENAIISPIVNTTGNITHFVAVKEDITDRKKMFEELVKAKNSAEEANRLKSIFLANMSHELRTPLVGILGFAELLTDELKDSSHIEMSETILKSGNRLMDTLNSLLDLSRIEANKMEMKTSEINFCDVLSESAKLFEKTVEGKGLQLKLNLPAKPIYIESDTQVLTKIFDNLINNAIKFTNSGSIIINVSREQQDSSEFVIAEFIDTGVGIADEYKEIIFEPFRQASEGFSRKFEGTGLGLSITKRLVDTLDGTITVKSSVGGGSTFTLKFPVTVNNRPRKMNNLQSNSSSEPNEMGFAAKTSILLVEDEPINADVIKTYLKEFSSVKHVTSGYDAVAACKMQRFDAILMDINLQGINGVTALEKIREMNSYYQEVPIIAMTAYAMMGDQEKFLSLGFDYYISKPFKRTELFGLLRNIFEK